ncbi:putative isomerase YbhE [Jackrogersella minutella]|nr:putative isomerase YbhE [Jackrogersella minutella]
MGGINRIIYLVMGLACASIAAAKNIYVASFAGPVFRLSFTKNDNGSYSLEQLDSTLQCGSNPGSLEFDQAGTLFCLNEAIMFSDSGSVASFSHNSLSVLDNITTDYGPAQSTFYAPNRLGLAHYTGSAVSVIDTSDPGKMIELQSFHYFMTKPGPNSTLQDKPYPHGIVADPTGKFVVVPDRGADALRIYSVGWDDRLVELGAYWTNPGNGPRHGVFVKGTRKTFFYFVGELTNSLHGFEVSYEENGTLGFKQHLVLSTRNDGRSSYQGEPSDTIASYTVDFETGDLSLIGLTASGGRWPQSFAISKDGKLIAVGNQYSVPGRLVVFVRDPETGVIDDRGPLATWTTNITLQDGESISDVLWDEA